MYYLYVITNLINGKQYYGWTGDCKRRWREHKCSRGSKLVPRAIKKYGIENFRFETLCEGTEKEVKNLEMLMIQENCSKVPYGYNLTDGGESNIPSLQTRKKLSLAQTGHKVSEETKKKLSLAQTGKTCSEETKKKMSLALMGNKYTLGYKHTEETKKKISLAGIGRKRSKETRKRISISKIGRKNAQYGKKGSKNPRARSVLINHIEYGSIIEATIILGYNYSTLRAKFRRFSKTNSFPVGWGYLEKE